MSWTNSKVFSAFPTDVLNGVAIDVDTDTIKAALYNDTITPSQTVTSANTAYGGTGVWTAGSSPNIQDASGWPYAGRQLLSVTSTFASNVYTYDAADTVSANDTTTIASAYGCLVYDDTMTSPADQGLSYHYFGGAQSVTSGRFTIVWNSSGIITLTL